MRIMNLCFNDVIRIAISIYLLAPFVYILLVFVGVV